MINIKSINKYVTYQKKKNARIIKYQHLLCNGVAE